MRSQFADNLKTTVFVSFGADSLPATGALSSEDLRDRDVRDSRRRKSS